MYLVNGGWQEPVMDQHIYQSFEKLTQTYPQKKALFYLGSSFTYLKLNDLVGRFAQSLKDIGLEEGERVIIYLPNSAQWVVSWLAVIRTGAVAVPISPVYTPRDLAYIAGDSGATTVVCMDGNFGYVKEIVKESALQNVVVTELLDLLPFHKRLFGRVSGKVTVGKVAREDGIYRFSELLRSPKTFDQPIRPDNSKIAELMYTGGTTKHPKGVPITHGVFLAGALEQSAHVRQARISPEEDVVYGSAPMFHVLGQALGLTTILTGGGTLMLDPKVNLDVIFDSIQRQKVKSLIGVPAFYRMILQHVRLEQYDLGSLRYCFCGGDTLPQEVANRWTTRFGFPLSQGYGATETCGGVSMCYAGEVPPPNSIGKVLPSKEIKIVDQQTLEPLPPGNPGELLVSAEAMVQAYWNKPEETAEAFVKIDGRIWYRTSDVVSMDQAGNLYFVDRTVDVIKHKGYRVSASEIEAVLQENPAVIASAVIGIPDKKVGERIKAFVVLKEDIKGITGYDLISWCRKRLASYKVPQYIEFRDMLPKSKVGKLLRREIRSDEKRRGEA